ncbi:hypothetical protein M501DRAFT_1013084 [Patellaria atrata CBS 101060]|uniref:BTB domain-containing protein n=1 Tax=Patellaria atrata CBS 101060 TaxID=1346257 RepID=A0A9P4VU16_9PEZI|nr:hypothetical protein M501DRAFT_1013084 [Patellaria atrata CBS 101060]
MNTQPTQVVQDQAQAAHTTVQVVVPVIIKLDVLNGNFFTITVNARLLRAYSSRAWARLTDDAQWAPAKILNLPYLSTIPDALTCIVGWMKMIGMPNPVLRVADVGYPTEGRFEEFVWLYKTYCLLGIPMPQHVYKRTLQRWIDGSGGRIITPDELDIAWDALDPAEPVIKTIVARHAWRGYAGRVLRECGTTHHGRVEEWVAQTMQEAPENVRMEEVTLWRHKYYMETETVGMCNWQRRLTRGPPTNGERD